MQRLTLLFAGGFLGSGKTTAIAGAAEYLRLNGKKVGVITNDQGVQQVDARFMRALGIDTEEVSSGCFCCNYDQLEKSVNLLRENKNPDIIFAESVGSCADLAATVINPLLTLVPGRYDVILSVFADIRLLVKFLHGEIDFFAENVSYIYEKQLDEADIIVASKIDLLTADEVINAKKIISSAFPGKTILYQNSLSRDGIIKWLKACEASKSSDLRQTLNIDYEKYAAGEGELAWLDEEIGIVSQRSNAVESAKLLMHHIYSILKEEEFTIGHLKFLLDNNITQAKFSYPSIDQTDDADLSELQETQRAIMLINARVQTPPEILQRVITDAIVMTEKESDCKIIENNLSVFRPGIPRPFHRIEV